MNNRMKEIIISVSDDNKEFTEVAASDLALNSPGLLGAKFNLETSGRFVKIQTDRRVGGDYGIGEVEIYSTTMAEGPTELVAQGVDGTPFIKLDWTNPKPYDMIRVVRKTVEKANSMENYPASIDEGVKVYEGRQESFVDKSKDLKEGHRYVC